jgi:putative thioredoxin
VNVIYDVTSENFELEVVQKSYKIPVLVDFWAEWCGPCKVLTPILEKVIRSMDGRVVLAKANTETDPALAAKFQIRGIPAVKLFRDGKIVSQFQGALPEDQVITFLDRFCPSEADYLVESGNNELAQHQLEKALQLFQTALKKKSDHDDAIIGMTRVLLRQEKLDEAEEWLQRVNPQNVKAHALKQFANLMQLAFQTAKSRAESQVDSPEFYFEKGLRALALMQWEQALEALLQSVKKDKWFQDEIARKTMLQLFDELGSKHDLTLTYQKRLLKSLY